MEREQCNVYFYSIFIYNIGYFSLLQNCLEKGIESYKNVSLLKFLLYRIHKILLRLQNQFLQV